MNHKKIEQIKALLETGFTEAQVKAILDASDDEILTAMGAEDLEESKPKTEEPRVEETAKMKKGPKLRFDEELFNKAKEMKANGDSYTHIAAKMGFSAGFVYKCLRFKTYEDLQEFREKDAKASAQRKRVAKMKKEGIVEPKKNYEPPKKSHEETAKPAISQELIEIRSMADSLERIAEALESIKELQVYKKRGLFHK